MIWSHNYEIKDTLADPITGPKAVQPIEVLNMRELQAIIVSMFELREGGPEKPQAGSSWAWQRTRLSARYAVLTYPRRARHGERRGH